MSKRIGLVLMLLALSGCLVDVERTVRTLESSGFSNVQILGYSWWACGEHDTYHTAFEATNPTGRRVRGTVCCGWLTKGCTVRF